MAKKKSKKQSKKQKKVVVSKEDNGRIWVGKPRNFRFLNPVGHPDRYKWITLNDGDVVPDEVLPILEREDGQEEAKKRVKALEEDLADDSKRNFSVDKDKKSPGRKSKSKKSSKK